MTLPGKLVILGSVDTTADSEGDIYVVIASGIRAGVGTCVVAGTGMVLPDMHASLPLVCCCR